jgi:hypothetical protein
MTADFLRRGLPTVAVSFSSMVLGRGHSSLLQAPNGDRSGVHPSTFREVPHLVAADELSIWALE